MAQRNRAAVDVDLGRVYAQLLVDGTGLGRKGFIELEQVDVLGLPARAFQCLTASKNRAHAHGGGVQARRCIGHDACQRRQAQGLGLGG
ncbi:hypothetical protein D3C86_1672910 [compost metagenome]